nr:hypothetical protein BaRGS_000183 [Batillaria attramentaria]
MVRIRWPSSVTLTNNEYHNILVAISPDVPEDANLLQKIQARAQHMPFRWGVFDEYGLQGEPQFYFSPKTGVVEGVRCTEKIEGIIYKINPDTGRPDYCHDVDAVTGVYPDGCEFHPYPGGPKTTGLKASIMDHVLIPPIASFCDDNEADDATVHNYDAPSRHNRLCGHRSTWAVISESEDFQSGKNPPRDGVATQPVFNLVKAPRSRRLILALDTSASMQVGELRNKNQINSNDNTSNNDNSTINSNKQSTS